MEEEKAAAYYDELIRKGEGAARFKQGLGFSAATNRDSAPSRGSALTSSSSFLSSFVKAPSPTQTSKFEKKARLEAIQNKLNKKLKDEQSSRVSERSSRDRESSLRHRSRSRERHYRRRSRSRSRSRERYGDRERRRRRSRSRSRSRSVSPRRDRRSERRGRNRSRSLSPRERRRSEKRSDDVERGKNAGVDYSRLIHGYEKMTPAERVKARMKLQLDETAKRDAGNGMGSGWERFEFNKDAPLDDEEIEAAEDDTAIVKHIGQSFRFSNLQAKREEQIKVAHDEAMFGASALPASITPDIGLETDSNKKESNGPGLATSLLSEKVLAKQKGSWRDRARKM